jgi:hypothetical protein
MQPKAGGSIEAPADEALPIATFCIRHAHLLLRADRGFAPMREYLGLQTLRFLRVP